MPNSPPLSFSVSEDTEDGTPANPKRRERRRKSAEEAEGDRSESTSLSLAGSSDEEATPAAAAGDFDAEARRAQSKLSDRIAAIIHRRSTPPSDPPKPPEAAPPPTKPPGDVEALPAPQPRTVDAPDSNPLPTAPQADAPAPERPPATPAAPPEAPARLPLAHLHHDVLLSTAPRSLSPASPPLPSPIYRSSPTALAAPPWASPWPQTELRFPDAAPATTSAAPRSEVAHSPRPPLPREESDLEDARVRQLVELLERATQQIRAEKARAKDLEKENEGLKHVPPAAPSPVDLDPKFLSLQDAHTQTLQKYRRLKQQHRELALENQMAIEQIAVLRIKCIDMQVALETERSKPPTAPPAPPPLTTAPPPPPPPPPLAIPPPEAKADPVVPRRAAQSLSLAGSRTRQSRPGPMTMPPQPPAPRARSSSPAVTCPPTRTRSPLPRSPSPSTRTSARRAGPASPRDDVLIHRMIRALSPPPTLPQLAKLVDSMVKELLRNLNARGVDLPLARLGNCVYSLHNRRLNLSVIADKLVVKVGGGHQDLLEYLHKTKGLRARPR